MVCPEHGEKLVGAPVMAVGLRKWRNSEVFSAQPVFFPMLVNVTECPEKNDPIVGEFVSSGVLLL